MSPQLTLEWSLLSEYTGNDTYRELAEGSVRKMMGNVSLYTPILDCVIPGSNLFSQCPFQVSSPKVREVQLELSHGQAFLGKV
jgi:hypothetical protein